jgi:hypothetical protein
MIYRDAEGSFPGKKIALLEDKTLLFVPMCAQAGDVICRFCPCPTPWVLRRTIQLGVQADLETTIVDRFLKFKSDLVSKPYDPTWSFMVWRGVSGSGMLEAYSAAWAIEDLSAATVEHLHFIRES